MGWWSGYEGAAAASFLAKKPFGIWLDLLDLERRESTDSFRETVLCPPENLDCTIYIASGRQYRALR